LFRNAYSRKRVDSVSYEYVVVSNTSGLGQKVIVVPLVSDVPSWARSASGTPIVKDC
jgi:hypothetical protein